MQRKKALVFVSLFVLMASMLAQFPVLPTISGTAEPGERLNLHAIDPETKKGVVIDLYDPERTVWIELYPSFNPVAPAPFAILSWKDGQVHPSQPGYGKLSPCDKVDLYNVTDPENPFAWPFVGFFHVDNVTVTLLVYNATNVGGHPAWIEFEGDIQDFPWTAPVSTQWHEKWPAYSLKYHLDYWVDQVPDGKLGPGDLVELSLKPAGPSLGMYLVADVGTDIWVTAMPDYEYVTMGGKVDGTLIMYVGVAGPNSRVGLKLGLKAPFATRVPLLKPNCLYEEIFFGTPVDVDANGVPDIIPIEKVQVNPIVHIVWIEFRAQYWMFVIKAMAPGEGVIFINPAMPGDVDCYTVNKDTGVWWAPPSQMAGTKAANSGGYYNSTTGDFDPPMASRFPGGGADGIPGTRLWGDPLEGFGDGNPDPVGSSILMLPLALLGYEWNATVGWELTIFTPMPLVLTTGKAYDHVDEPASGLYCMSSTEEGKPWDASRIRVTYVAAWSNLLYCLNPDKCKEGWAWNGTACVRVPEEPPTGMYYCVDFFYEYSETKVLVGHEIPDVNDDDLIDIFDVVTCAIAYGSHDEGFGKKVADHKYNPRVDMNCDGVIDIADIVIIAVAFGRHFA